METPKKFFVSQEMELSYISGSNLMSSKNEKAHSEKMSSLKLKIA